MNARPTLTHLVLLLVFTASGCFAFHERSATTAVSDADAGPPSADCEQGCVQSTRTVEVRSTDGGSLPDGDVLTNVLEITPDPATDGLRFRVDSCPGGADPCVRTFLVTGVGADLVDELSWAPRSPMASMLATMHVTPHDFILQNSCGDCLPDLLFAAHDDAGAEPTPELPSGFIVGKGNLTCGGRDPGPSGGASHRYAVRLTVGVSLGTTDTLEADEGDETVARPEGGAIYGLRDLRSSATACATSTPLAWVAFLAGPSTGPAPIPSP